MKTLALLTTIGLLCLMNSVSAQNVFNPNDPIVNYDPARPPATPANNTMSKWVRTVRMTWNTDRFKAYYFNGMAFRLRYPNNYNPADLTKKYPIIVFFHGAGEIAPITDNEYQMVHGADLFEQKINNGEFNGFMLYPQVSNTAWDYFYYAKINSVLDSLQKYANLDPDRVISSGLSNGGLAAIFFADNFPQHAATVISSSPALIQLAQGDIDKYIHIPIWMVSGGVDLNPDTTSAKNFVQAFVNKGGSMRYELYPTLGHNTWYQQWSEPYLVPTWQNAHKANPLIFFQRDKFCNDTLVNAKLGVTGGFYQYQWQKDNVDIPGAVSNELNVTRYGTYRVHFKRSATAAWSDWSPIPAVIGASAPTVTPAIQVDGIKSIVLPTLDGSTTTSLTLPADYLAYEWLRTSDNAVVSTQPVFTAPVGQYKARVKEETGCFAGYSPVFTVVNANGNPKPDATSNLTATVISETSIGLAWTNKLNPTVDETGYEIYRGTVSGGPYTMVYRNPANTSAYTDQNLLANTTYYYKIRPVNATGAAAATSQASAKTNGDVVAPTAPSGLKVIANYTTYLQLSWNKSTDNVGVKQYDIYVNGNSTYNTTDTFFTMNNLVANQNLSIYVKARDLAGNLSASSNVVSTSNVLNGLNYKLYLGEWYALPDFTTLTPVQQGITPNVDISVRPSGAADFFGFLWEGYVKITKPGTYTFETISDDGSKMYFNSMYAPAATPLINNDGLHGITSVSGTVTLQSAGVYPVAFTFFDRIGGDNMEVYWSGPGFSRQRIPDSAFTSKSTADVAAPSAPANLKVISVSTGFVHLDWDVATDNASVPVYDVYVNNVKKYTVAGSAITANNLTAGTTYTFNVKARDIAGNSSAASNTVMATTTTAANGLNYRFYQGNWTALPDFSTLTPAKTGTSANVDVTVRTAGVNDYYGFVWEGYINIPAPGTYTFQTISDDGSKLYFDSVYAPSTTATINNDGLHGYSAISTTITVATAGMHPIAMTFFNGTGQNYMEVYWTGPGFSRQSIPAAAFIGVPSDVAAPSVPANLKVVAVNKGFVHLDWDNSTDNSGVPVYDVYVNNVKKYTVAGSAITANNLTAGTNYTFNVVARDIAGNSSAASNTVMATTTTTANGLNYRFYQGNWTALPDFSTLTPAKTGTSANVDVTVRTAGVNDYYGFVWEGYINIPAPGTYTFQTISDDGSKLYFDSVYAPSTTATINNDGLHGYSAISTTITVATAGMHPIAMTFFNGTGQNYMEVYWTGPGFSRQSIPAAAFTETALPGVANRNNALTATGEAAASITANSTNTTKLYPNPVSDQLNIDLQVGAAKSEIGVGMYDMNGNLVYNRNFANVASGNNTLTMNIAGSNLAPGVYMVKIQVNGIPSRTIKVVKANR